MTEVCFCQSQENKLIFQQICLCSISNISVAVACTFYEIFYMVRGYTPGANIGMLIAEE